MKFNHCSSRRFLQEEAPFRNNPSPSVTFSPDPLLNATSMASTPAMKKPFKLPNVPFDSSMALTVLILVTALFFLAFFSVYLRRLSSSSFSSSTSPRRPTSDSSPPPPSSSSRSCFSKGLDASTIKSLPQVPYGAAAKHPIDCPICLAEFDENDTVKMIPHCGHVFHPTCLDTWLSSHVTCPLCRSTRICVGSGEEVRLAVAQEDGDRSSVSAFGENLTVDQGDTLREVGSLGVRRTCSCSSLGNRACLQRSTSL